MKNKPIIFFDGVCNLCNSSVQFVLKHEKEAYFWFASLQSDFGQDFLKENNLNLKDFDSIILSENNQVYDKSSAALRIAKKLNFPYSLLYIFIIIPRFLSDFVYSIIAKNRYKWFGQSEACSIPSPETKARFLE